MERILLIEPNYKNKYPPIGLMKISTYYKRKGDFVEFHKGLMPQSDVKNFDKVFITTLFTFDFNMCLHAIQYYIAIVGVKNVYVGGIAATIMPENFRKSIPDLNLIECQLTSSSMLGYRDNENIDILPLDYDILWDISYEYPSANSYFIYTSRGCPRKCDFCAVKTLEPTFYDCDNIEEQIRTIDRNFGIKKNLLIMDNNILFSKRLNLSIDSLYGFGFGTDNNKIKKNNPIPFYLTSLVRRIEIGKKYDQLLIRIKKEFLNLAFNRINKSDTLVLQNINEMIRTGSDSDVINILLNNRDFLIEFYNRYHYHKISRFVDFNQGLDARLFTNEKAEQLGRLAINPCRIAFDHLETREAYIQAMDYCVDNGITRFSNYLLYNFDETPSDLWNRLYLNIQFCTQHEQITLFSFPMKYADINQTDRTYIGEHWNKKFLRAMNIILNVTAGIVAKEEDFFLRAFGNNPEEFVRILTMPDEFIRYRDFFEKTGLTQLWDQLFNSLSPLEKKQLTELLAKLVDDPDSLHYHSNAKLNAILPYYFIRKHQIDNNPLYYENFVCNHASKLPNE